MTSGTGGFILFLILIGIGCLILWFFIFKVKHLKTPDVYMVDGGVKTGKSLVSVMLAVKQYRKNLIRYFIGNCILRFINVFRRIRKVKPRKLIERPMLYSNMPLYKVKYNEFTLDILYRKVRIPHKSVCLLDEATLLADSLTGMCTKKAKKETFDEVNEALTIFLKLYGHATHGGSCFYNSQNVVDLHFAFRRCTALYLNIFKNRKFPFFCLLDVREFVHDESNDTTNAITKDVDEDSKPLFVSKRWYKYYDRYYLDVLTKDLPLLVDYNVQAINTRTHQELKQIVTLTNYKSIIAFNEKMKKEGLEHAQE